MDAKSLSEGSIGLDLKWKRPLSFTPSLWIGVFATPLKLIFIEITSDVELVLLPQRILPPFRAKGRVTVRM